MPNQKEKDISDLAREAILVQDACNIRGVLRAAHEASLILGRHPECNGTDWINNHPVMVLFADKIQSLATMSGDNGYSEAWTACFNMSENKKE